MDARTSTRRNADNFVKLSVSLDLVRVSTGNSELNVWFNTLGPLRRVLVTVLGIARNEFTSDGELTASCLDRLSQTLEKDRELVLKMFSLGDRAVDAYHVFSMIARVAGITIYAIINDEAATLRCFPGVNNKPVYFVQLNYNDTTGLFSTAIYMPRDQLRRLGSIVGDVINSTFLDKLMVMTSSVPSKYIKSEGLTNELTIVQPMSPSNFTQLQNDFPSLSLSFDTRVSCVNHPVGRAYDNCFARLVDLTINRIVPNSQSIWDVSGRVSDAGYDTIVVPVVMNARDEVRVGRDASVQLSNIERQLSQSVFDFDEVVKCCQRYATSSREAQQIFQQFLQVDDSISRYRFSTKYIQRPDFNPYIGSIDPINCDVLILRHCAYEFSPNTLFKYMSESNIQKAFIVMHYLPQIELMDMAFDPVTTHCIIRLGDDKIRGTFIGDAANGYTTSVNHYMSWIHLPAVIERFSYTFVTERILSVGSLTCFEITKSFVTGIPVEVPRALYSGYDKILVGSLLANDRYQYHVTLVNSEQIKNMESLVRAMGKEPDNAQIASIINSSTHRVIINKSVAVNDNLARLSSADRAIMALYLRKVFREFNTSIIEKRNRTIRIRPKPWFIAGFVTNFVFRSLNVTVPTLVRGIVSLWRSVTNCFSLGMVHTFNSFSKFLICLFTPRPKVVIGPIGRLFRYFDILLDDTIDVAKERFYSIPIVGPFFRPEIYEAYNPNYVALLLVPAVWIGLSYLSWRSMYELYLLRFDRKRYVAMNSTRSFVPHFNFRKRFGYLLSGAFVFSLIDQCDNTTITSVCCTGLLFTFELIERYVSSWRQRNINDNTNNTDGDIYNMLITTFASSIQDVYLLDTSSIVVSRYEYYEKEDYVEDFDPCFIPSENDLYRFERCLNDALYKYIESSDSTNRRILDDAASACTDTTDLSDGARVINGDDCQDRSSVVSRSSDNIDALFAIVAREAELVPNVNDHVGMDSNELTQFIPEPLVDENLTTSNFREHPLSYSVGLGILVLSILAKNPKAEFVFVNVFNKASRCFRRFAKHLGHVHALIVERDDSSSFELKNTKFRFGTFINYLPHLNRKLTDNSASTNVYIVVADNFRIEDRDVRDTSMSLRNSQFNTILLTDVDNRSILRDIYSNQPIAIPFLQSVCYIDFPEPSALKCPVAYNKCPNCNILQNLCTKFRISKEFYYPAMRRCDIGRQALCSNTSRTDSLTSNPNNLPSGSRSASLTENPQLKTIGSFFTDSMKSSLETRLNVYRKYCAFRNDFYGPDPLNVSHHTLQYAVRSVYPRLYLPPIHICVDSAKIYECIADFLLRESGMVFSTFNKLHTDYEHFERFKQRHSKEEKSFSYIHEEPCHEFYLNIYTKEALHQVDAFTSIMNKSAKPEDLITCDDLLYCHSYHNIQTNLHRRHTMKFRLERIIHFDGIAGCGKTTKIKELINRYGENNVIVAAQSKSGASEIGKTVKTIGSILENNVTITGVGVDVLIIDEAVMCHPGQLMLLAAVTHARIMVMFGDAYQINYINRDSHYTLPIPSFPLPIEKLELNHTYRCPLDVCRIITSIYGRVITTANSIKSSITFNHGSSAAHISKIEDFDLIITMTQMEKAEVKRLVNKPDRVRTVHEAQGMSVGRVAFVRTLTKDIPLFMRDNNGRLNSHVLVMLTRHTKTFCYMSTLNSESDCLSNSIRAELNNHIDVNYVSSDSDMYESLLSFLPCTSRFSGKYRVSATKCNVKIDRVPSDCFDRRGIVRAARGLLESNNCFNYSSDLRLSKDDEIPYIEDINRYISLNCSKSALLPSSSKLTPKEKPAVSYIASKNGDKNACWYVTLKNVFHNLNIKSLSAAVSFLKIPFGSMPSITEVLMCIAWRLDTTITSIPCNQAPTSWLKFFRFNDRSELCDGCICVCIEINDCGGHIEQVSLDLATHVICVPAQSYIGCGYHVSDNVRTVVGSVKCGNDFSVITTNKMNKLCPINQPSLSLHHVVGDYGFDESVFANHIRHMVTLNNQAHLSLNRFEYDIINYPSVDFPKTSLPTFNIDNFIVMAQSEYNVLCPDVCNINALLDRFVNQHSDIFLETSNLVFSPVKINSIERYPLSRNPSILRTNWYPNHQQTLSQILLCVNERNWNVPKLQSNVCKEVYAMVNFNKFMKAYCCDNYESVLSSYEQHPIEFTEQYLNEWISKIPNDKRAKYVDSDLLISNLREFYYTATLKGVNKATGESTINTKIPKGQVINAMPESVCLYYSLVMRAAIDRIRALLRSNVLLAIGYNDDYINNWINFYVQPTNNYQYYECDFSAFDKSISSPHLALFLYLMKRVGFSDELIDFWECTHNYTRSRCHQGASWYVGFQTKSGDPATAFSNTIFNMTALADLVLKTNPECSMFMGDDSLIISKYSVNISNFDYDIGCSHGFSAKLIKPVVGQFCGSYLVPINGKFLFVTDVVKRFEKLGSQDNPDVLVLAERFISLQDRTKSIKSLEISIALAECIQKRYNSTITPFNLVWFISFISSDFNSFLRLYNINYFTDNESLQLLNSARDRLMSKTAGISF